MPWRCSSACTARTWPGGWAWRASNSSSTRMGVAALRASASVPSSISARRSCDTWSARASSVSSRPRRYRERLIPASAAARSYRLYAASLRRKETRRSSSCRTISPLFDHDLADGFGERLVKCVPPYPAFHRAIRPTGAMRFEFLIPELLCAQKRVGLEPISGSLAGCSGRRGVFKASIVTARHQPVRFGSNRHGVCFLLGPLVRPDHVRAGPAVEVMRGPAANGRMGRRVGPFLRPSAPISAAQCRQTPANFGQKWR